MPRIVSLIASATEIVAALGFADQLVGRSHECDYPESVRRLPVCTQPKFNTEGTSYQIDQRVKAILQEGLSVYRVHGDVLRQLRPDVIVTQAQCEVCAVSQRDVEQAVCDWLDGRPMVVSLAPNNLADGNQYFNRPGPRLVESLEILAEVLHPEAFHFGHERAGWVSWPMPCSRR